MKALIICSTHALCDIAALERDACNHACAQHGIPAILTARDQALALETATMLDVLNHLPGSIGQRKALIDTYLDALNNAIWTASPPAHQSVFAALLDPDGYARPTGFVSDYPMLTTNLIRSSALLHNATKLGTLTPLSDRSKLHSTAERLAATAAALGVAHASTDVIVAHQRDFLAAQSVGMQPRFIAKMRRDATPWKRHRRSEPRLPAGSMINSVPISQPVGVPI